MTVRIFVASLVLANIAPSTCLIISESLGQCDDPPPFTLEPSFGTSAGTTVSWGNFKKTFTEGEVADAVRALGRIFSDPQIQWVYQAVQFQEDLNKQCENSPTRSECKSNNPYWKSIACILDAQLSPPKDEAAFWSGGIHTSYYARAMGKMTLENTPAGRVFDLMNKYWGSDKALLPIPWKALGELWNNLSKRYAGNVRGNVDVYMRMPDVNSVLYRQEYPMLKARKDQHFINEMYFVFLMGPTPRAGHDEKENKYVAVKNLISTGRFSHAEMEQLAQSWGLKDATALDAANQLLACHYVEMAEICNGLSSSAGSPGCPTKSYGLKHVDKRYSVQLPPGFNRDRFCNSQLKDETTGREIGFLTDPYGWLDVPGTLGRYITKASVRAMA